MVKLFKVLRTGLFVCLAGFSSLLFAASVEDEVRSVVEENIAATQSEDMGRMMRTIHGSSPSYQATLQQVPPLFQQYDLEYELKGYDFVGVTGEFAVVKVRQTTRKIAGAAAFNDNELELLQAFKKEGGQWKFWSQTILSMKMAK